MLDSNGSESPVKLQRLRRGKITYLIVVTIWTIASVLFVLLVNGVTSFALSNAVWWSSCGVAFGGLGIYCWRKTLDFEVTDRLVRKAEHAALAIVLGQLCLFVLLVLSMGFAYEPFVVCPILIGSLAVGICWPDSSSNSRAAETGAKVAAVLFGFTVGGALSLLARLALLLTTVELRGEVTNRIDVFSVEREFDSGVDMLIAALSLVPGAIGLLIARFASRFGKFFSGLGFGALIVGLIMAGNFLFS